MVASGTFGYGREYAEFFDLSRLGAVMVKGSPASRGRETLRRIVETPSGMLNAIGLQNPGSTISWRSICRGCAGLTPVSS